MVASSNCDVSAIDGIGIQEGAVNPVCATGGRIRRTARTPILPFASSEAYTPPICAAQRGEQDAADAAPQHAGSARSSRPVERKFSDRRRAMKRANFHFGPYRVVPEYSWSEVASEVLDGRRVASRCRSFPRPDHANGDSVRSANDRGLTDEGVTQLAPTQRSLSRSSSYSVRRPAG